MLFKGENSAGMSLSDMQLTLSCVGTLVNRLKKKKLGMILDATLQFDSSVNDLTFTPSHGQG